MRDRVRERLGPRAGGIAFALAIEVLLVLLLVLTLAPRVLTPPDRTVPLSVFGVSPEEEPKVDTKSAPPAAATVPRPATQPRPQPAEPDPATQPRPAEQPQPQPTPPPFLNIPLSQAPDIGALPRGPAGPPNLARVAGDTPRVEGRGPRGEPLYAASWYREPYDSEMRGYLSTARGPGWGMIACRTVADFRVDNCALLDEYPEGSNIGRAVLAMAWQFRVRPPRLGGVPQVGEWVRIRISYDTQARPD
jgi:protein TonB